VALDKILKIFKKAKDLKSGVNTAIKEVGKDKFKKHAKNVPEVVRGNVLKKDIKRGKKQAAKTKGHPHQPIRYTKEELKRMKDQAAREQAGVKAWKTRKKSVEEGKKPDRHTLLGKKGYNYHLLNEGGSVTKQRRLAKRGWGVTKRK
jgi:hypothetical protein